MDSGRRRRSRDRTDRVVPGLRQAVGLLAEHDPPYLTEHINRFGEYSTHELGIQPEAYDPKLDVDFTPLRDQHLASTSLGQAA